MPTFYRPASTSAPRRIVVGFAVLLLATYPPATPAQITSSAPPSATTIHVHITRPASPRIIPPTVFGSFLEPIGHAVYGGLWADVIENGSFEEGLWSLGNLDTMLHERPELRRASQLGLPTPWEPLHASDGNRYLPVRGDAANSTQSVLIMSLPGKEIGIRERVYLSPQRELHYIGALWIKHVRGGSAVRVSVRRHAHPENTLASTSVTASATEWTQYPFDLTLLPGQLDTLEPADLAITLDDDARAMIDQVTLQPADNIAGMDPDMIGMLQDLHSPLLRFGGNFTSAYEWKDGIGPVDKRVSKLNFSWGIPEYNTFGTDEFLRLCDLIHAQPQIALNLGTGTPEAAADWVRYVNQHFGDHTGGLLWELGNELWGDFQIGYPSQERVAAVTRATSQAVRAVDPHARLIATGADEDHFNNWNAAQLSNPPGTFQFLSTHFVVNAEVQLPHPPDDFRTMASLALPIGLSKQMHAMHDQIEASPHKGDVKTAFTEWLMIGGKTAPNYTNMGGALFTGGFLNTILRDADIVPISDMTGNVEFGGIWKKRGQVYPAPAYWVLRAYATAAPHTLLSVQSDGPTYSVSHGVNRLPEIANVPYLDLTAAESADGKRLLLFCVNRSLFTAAHVELDLSNLKSASGPMRITTLEGETILAENTEEQPDLVKPVTSTETVRPGKLAHTFPNASVTVLEIPLAGK
jgi:alpha-N-arabinofuranosidase